MTEETTPEKPVTKKEEKVLSVLEQIKQEKEAVEKANEEARENINKLTELKAIDMLSGKTDQPQPVKKEEISNEDYAKMALEGKVPEK